MRDEMGNTVMPSEFLPAAERYNLSDKVDRWVIGHALNWLRDHPKMIPQFHLCGITLSGQSLGNEAMLRCIIEQIDEGGTPAKKLCFEVTETAAISDLEQAMNFITLLKDRGCMFALDDFGSGFSSFAYLKRLPVDFLKMDGSLFATSAPTQLTLLWSARSVKSAMLWVKKPLQNSSRIATSLRSCPALRRCRLRSRIRDRSSNAHRPVHLDCLGRLARYGKPLFPPLFRRMPESKRSSFRRKPGSIECLWQSNVRMRRVCLAVGNRTRI
jgi:hypothetical protein